MLIIEGGVGTLIHCLGCALNQTMRFPPPAAATRVLVAGCSGVQLKVKSGDLLNFQPHTHERHDPCNELLFDCTK